MTMATELARRIRAFTYDGLQDTALEWAKTGILDTVGVTLAGSAEPCAQIMLRVCTATGPASHITKLGNRRFGADRISDDCKHDRNCAGHLLQGRHCSAGKSHDNVRP